MIEECLIVEFSVTGDNCPLSEASRQIDSTIDCNPPQFRSDNNSLLRFTAKSERLAEILDEDERIRYLHVSKAEEVNNYRCLSKHPCVVQDLTDVGFMSESIEYHDGTEFYRGAVVGREVLRGVLETARETVGVKLERMNPLGSEDDEAVATRWDLTPAQEEALRTAHSMGYFEVPRQTKAQEVADEIGISKSAFLERIKRGQASVFESVFV